tara:strand:- start:11313 stop:11516 length:204 start_codon:yes stop_codon:yes gene_type:complete
MAIELPNAIEIIDAGRHTAAFVELVRDGFFEFAGYMMDQDDIVALEEWCRANGTGGYWDAENGWQKV